MSSPGIAHCLELKQLDSDSFVNAWPPWLPPGAQGIYGGSLIAHSLVAAQRTVPAEFVPSSMHCNFLVGGGPDDDITYRAERLGEDTVTPVRTVRAHQKEKCIFKASLGFKTQWQHVESKSNTSYTNDPVFTLPDAEGERDITGGGLDDKCPYVCSKVEISHSEDGRAEKARTWQKVKTRDAIQQDPGGLLHTAAIAYMTDNYFLPTTSRVRNILWSREPEMEKGGQIAADAQTPTAHVGLMVTLDRSIYFHTPSDFRADEWMVAEMEAPWSGEGRNLVLQRIYKQDGTIIATALQEGAVRFDWTPLA